MGHYFFKMKVMFFPMCCKGEVQDQNEIAEIKSVTESRISSTIMQMDVDRVKKRKP